MSKVSEGRELRPSLLFSAEEVDAMGGGARGDEEAGGSEGFQFRSCLCGGEVS